MKEIFVELIDFSGADYGVIYDSDKEKISFSHKLEFSLETRQRIVKLLKRVSELQKEERCPDVEKRLLFKKSFQCNFLENFFRLVVTTL